MLPYRGHRGYQVYATGMEASAGDKAKILRFVRPGVIAELGCGTGAVLALLRKKFPRSQLMGADLSEEMATRCRARFPGMEIRIFDITRKLFDDGTLDTIVLCSVMHEVFSYNGYDYRVVRETLGHCADAIKSGGRLIIRDGLKPARQDVVYITFLNGETKLAFIRFAREFGSSEIVWREVDGRIQVARRDAMEFLTKYIYDVNWVYEVKEHFGVFSLEEWVSELSLAGLRVIHKESYVLPWLRSAHWERDVRLEVKVGQKYRPTDYPHSTMILVGEK